MEQGHKVWCTSIEFSEIFQYIHQCNEELHVIFEEIKSKKLKRLLPPVEEISENKLVVTIPSDLPLDSSECSLLGKGLGCVPTNRKPEKFQSLQDLSKFYRKIRLHAFFNNLDQTIDDRQDFPRRMPLQGLRKEVLLLHHVRDNLRLLINL